MNTREPLHRPEVMDELSETQLRELEFQASEYDAEQFLELGATYGWDPATVKAVWAWFEVQNHYPLED